MGLQRLAGTRTSSHPELVRNFLEELGDIPNRYDSAYYTGRGYLGTRNISIRDQSPSVCKMDNLSRILLENKYYSCFVKCGHFCIF